MLSYSEPKAADKPASLSLHQARELLTLALADINNNDRDWYDTMNIFDRAVACVQLELLSAHWQDEENILLMECFLGKIKNAMTFNGKGSDQQALEISHAVIDTYKASPHHGKASYEYYLAAAAAMMHYINEKVTARELSLLTEPLTEKLINAVHGLIKDFNHKVAGFALIPRMSDDQATQLSRLHYQLSRFYQFTRNHEMALKHGNAAIHIRSIRGFKTRAEFLELADMYTELATSFQFDKVYAQFFQFASDFYSGKNPVNFQRYLALDMLGELQDPDFSYRETLLEFLRLTATRYAEPALPDSEFKQQLNFSAQFQNLHRKYEDQESNHIESILATKVKEVPAESPPLSKRATELLISEKRKPQKFFKPKPDKQDDKKEVDRDAEKKPGMENK